MTKFSVVFARDYNGGFGYKNTIPWKIPGDLKLFKVITSSNSEGKINNLIMGRKTWESLPKALPNRREIVITRNKELLGLSSKMPDTFFGFPSKNSGVQRNDRNRDTIFVNSLESALEVCSNYMRSCNFVIGGSKLLEESFNHPELESIYYTLIRTAPHINFDTYFDTLFPLNFELVYEKKLEKSEDTLDEPIFSKWNKIVKTQEVQFNQTLLNVLENGEIKGDRTGTGTHSIFGEIQMIFDLQESFPLLTSKFVPLRLVFEELMWMLRGQTNIKFLEQKKCMIWHENYNSNYAKNIRQKYNYPEGELGPLYGAQWRNFNGNHDLTPISDEDAKDERKGRHIANNKNGGVDQIKFVINEIKNNPDSRRILINAWNPSVLDSEKDSNLLDKVTLPSCHNQVQFNVKEKKYLNAKLYVRSNDLFLGAPFNIASYSLLIHIIASMTGLLPGKLIYTIGDAHIYNNHVDQVKELLDRPLRSLPRLEILNVHENIEDFEFTDLKIEGYDAHPNIKGKMAV